MFGQFPVMIVAKRNVVRNIRSPGRGDAKNVRKKINLRLDPFDSLVGR